MKAPIAVAKTSSLHLGAPGRSFRFARLAVTCLGLALGCQSLVGIENRRLGPCGEYCDTVMSACQGEYAVYTTFEACMGVCELLPEGSSLEPQKTNTVACRLAEAKAAAATEPDVHCPGAGPGGGDACGSDCESYCMLYKDACGSSWYNFEDNDQCVTACSALRDRGAFDAQLDHDGDTLQCRLVHTSSATVEPETHCGHASLAPPTAPCVNPPDAEPDCSQYCHALSIACHDSNAQFESYTGGDSQCEKVCRTLDAGTNSDTNVNTMGCRMYHTYNALISPDVHCGHAGPTGDGHCGMVDDTENAICDAYCKLADEACHEAFVLKYADVTCPEECKSLKGAKADSHFTVASGAKGGSTLDCRLLHAVRALTGELAACESALGKGECK